MSASASRSTIGRRSNNSRSVSPVVTPPQQPIPVETPAVTPQIINESTPQVTSVQTIGTCEPENIDIFLKNQGYTIIHKLKDTNGVKYVKAFNPWGEMLYIYVDVPSSCHEVGCRSIEACHAAPPKDINLNKTLDIYGMLFECDKGNVCAMHRNDKDMAIFDTYTYKSDNLHNSTLEMPYPLVLMSDIKENSPLLLKSVDESFRSMRNKAYSDIMDRLKANREFYNEYLRLIKSQSTNIEIFMAHTDAVYSNLLKDISQLDRIAMDHREIKNPDLDTRKKYELVIKNIEIRHQVSEEFMRCVDSFNGAQEALKAVMPIIENNNASICLINNKIGEFIGISGTVFKK